MGRTATALLLVGLVSNATSGPVSTCDLQSKCTMFTDSVPFILEGGGNCYDDDTCVVEVCFKTGVKGSFGLFPDCTKEAGDDDAPNVGLSHTCTNSNVPVTGVSQATPQCSFPDPTDGTPETYYSRVPAWDSTSPGPSYTDGTATKFCQYGVAGQTLEFSAKDGGGDCTGFAAPQGNINCEPAEQDTLCAGGGKNLGSECLWTYKVPDITCNETGNETGLDGVQGDPMVFGFKNQVFLFKGANDAWYAALAERHLQWNWRLSVFPSCENGAQPTYVTASAFTFPPGPDGDLDKAARSKVLVEVLDVEKYNPNYVQGEESTYRAEQILGYGSLGVTIEGKQIVKPGAYDMANGGVVMAFNAYGPCQVKRDLHMMEELNKAQRRKGSSLSRHLSETAVDDDLAALLAVESGLHKAEDVTLCEAWIAEKRVERDLFTAPGSWASVFVLTDTYSFQVDYRQEIERCFAHVLDVTFIHKPDDVGVEHWSGVMGETQSLRLDSQGKPIVRERDIILSSSKDEDYIVDGPWGTDFVARLDSAWEPEPMMMTE